MDDPNSTTQQTVSFISAAVTGRPVIHDEGAPSSGSGSTPGATLKNAQGMAVQSVAQSMAIAIQDATDMLRNISTVATTAIGVAAAKWIETPEMMLYQQIITTAQGLIKQAADDFLTIGKNAGTVLTEFDPES